MRPPRRTPVRPAQAHAPGSAGDPATWGLVALAAILTVGTVLWCGAALSSVLTGHRPPDGGLMAALSAPTRIGDPASVWSTPQRVPGPLAYWACTVLVSAVVAIAAVLGARAIRGFTDARAASADSIRSLPGLATARDAEAAAGRDALLRRAPIIRPSAGTDATPSDVGYRLGCVRGRELWCSVEDSALVVGPPRMGKGLHLVIPWVLDAPGPVVATSTRPDTLAVTFHARTGCGPVAVFDPQGLAGPSDGLRWSPVRGCEKPQTALVRARGLGSGAGFGASVSDSDFWSGQTETALRCLLHAAALDGRGALDLYRWSLNPVLAEDAVTILNRQSGAAPGWAEALDATIHADPRTRDSIWLGVRQSLAALADPDVLRRVDPGPNESFDPVEFLKSRGTLFLLASAVASASCAPLVAAFVEDITETARTQAARSPGARLDPPLLLALDEIANLTPLPSLPSLMAEGGGSGITTLAVLQSLAQARHRWGEHAADAIWDSATVKLVLGGLAKMRDLDDVSRLLGDIDEPVETLSRGRGGERSWSTSLRQVPVMPPSVLRTLPFGTGVLLLRHTLPVVIDLVAWPDRADAEALHAGRTKVEDANATPTPPPTTTATGTEDS